MEWLAAGYSESLYWDLTPRQLRIHFEAHFERLRREHNDRAWLAWHTAALQREKRMTPLEKLTSNRKRARRGARGQPWQEQRNVARMLTVLYGGTITERPTHA